VLAGATATGKTGLSLAITDHLSSRGGPPAEIISADSRQIYRGMDIGTAKVDATTRMRIPHHGLDLVDPDGAFTAADFRAHALEALAGIAARGHIAILVGGTGLYLRIVARGVPIDEAGHDPRLRAELDARLAAEGLDRLVAELAAIAPVVAARTDLRNPRRVVRALERASLLGDRPPPEPAGYPNTVAWLGTRLDRAEHDRLIEARAREQFASGLLEEAASLRARYGDGLRSYSAMGYAEAFAVLDGHATLEEAIAADARRTRRYARRQETWFRSEPDIVWLPGTDDRIPEAFERTMRWLETMETPIPGGRAGVSPGATAGGR
jgi:tRNA dimethylallyltransferase